jgi:hypothetical protein
LPDLLLNCQIFTKLDTNLILLQATPPLTSSFSVITNASRLAVKISEVSETPALPHVNFVWY